MKKRPHRKPAADDVPLPDADDVLRRMLSTPPELHSKPLKKTRKRKG